MLNSNKVKKQMNILTKIYNTLIISIWEIILQLVTNSKMIKVAKKLKYHIIVNYIEDKNGIDTNLEEIV